MILGFNVFALSLILLIATIPALTVCIIVSKNIWDFDSKREPQWFKSLAEVFSVGLLLAVMLSVVGLVFGFFS